MGDINRNDNRLELLRKREAVLRAAIARERGLQQRREDRNRTRLISIVGSAVIDHAADLEFNFMLREILKTSVLDTRDQKFVRDMGWL
jgi:hypothetical protein